MALWRCALPEDPLAILEELVALRDLGLRKILPVTAELAAEFIDTCRQSKSKVALASARQTFEDKYGESRNRFVRMAFGGDVSADVDFDDLLIDRIGDNGEIDWAAAGLEPNPELDDNADAVFCALARKLWLPLLTHEVDA